MDIHAFKKSFVLPSLKTFPLSSFSVRPACRHVAQVTCSFTAKSPFKTPLLLLLSNSLNSHAEQFSSQ